MEGTWGWAWVLGCQPEAPQSAFLVEFLLESSPIRHPGGGGGEKVRTETPTRRPNRVQLTKGCVGGMEGTWGWVRVLGCQPEAPQSAYLVKSKSTKKKSFFPIPLTAARGPETGFSGSQLDFLSARGVSTT